MENFDLRKYLAENLLLKEELKDIEDVLEKAGFSFWDGILGGVGSGGAGYYDAENDDIYGYNQEGPWNEEAFNKFYDNFSFASYEFYQEDFEDIDFDMIYKALEPGIYSVGERGYAKIPPRVPNRDGGDMIELFAAPFIEDEAGENQMLLFKMDDSGKAIPQFSKDEMRKLLKDDMYYII